MNESLPTVEEANLNQLYDVVRRLDPELYLIKIALHETGLNPLIIPKIIRAISGLAVGTGYGKIQVFMESKIVTQVSGEERTQVNEKAIVDKI